MAFEEPGGSAWPHFANAGGREPGRGREPVKIKIKIGESWGGDERRDLARARLFFDGTLDPSEGSMCPDHDARATAWPFAPLIRSVTGIADADHVTGDARNGVGGAYRERLAGADRRHLDPSNVTSLTSLYVYPP
jgi:hypothetical protein